MEKINYITVNGVTYEIGGSPNGNSYILPEAFYKLNSGASAEEVKAVFGTDEEFNNFVQLAKDSTTNFYINFSKALYPVKVKYTNMIVLQSFYFSWFYTRDTSPDSSEVTLTLALNTNNGVKSFLKEEYKVVIDNKLKVNIYNLTESSSNEDIQNALTTSWSFSKVVSNKGAKMEAQVRGSDGITSYYFMDLGVIVLDEQEGYTYKISCNLPGCFGKAKGGIIHIKEDASGQYSVIKIDEF